MLPNYISQLLAIIIFKNNKAKIWNNHIYTYHNTLLIEYNKKARPKQK